MALDLVSSLDPSSLHTLTNLSRYTLDGYATDPLFMEDPLNLPASSSYFLPPDFELPSAPEPYIPQAVPRAMSTVGSSYTLQLVGTPPKARTDKQNKICLQLLDRSGQRVTSFRKLRFPTPLVHGKFD